jgi:hypothetical protein
MGFLNDKARFVAVSGKGRFQLNGIGLMLRLARFGQGAAVLTGEIAAGDVGQERRKWILPGRDGRYKSLPLVTASGVRPA